MPTLRIANANIEWMNYWFTNDSDPVAWKTTFVQDGQTNNTAKTAKRAAAMIKAIDPDVLAVQEGPSREGELALLYKPASVTSASLAPHPTITGLIDPWEADVDGDMLLEPDYHFTRNPLIVNLKLGAHRLQIIVMHTKSSFVDHGAALWNDPVTRHDYVVAALKARRRNGTEGMRVREYLDAQLGTDSQAAIIVAGDLNDGPGLDYFEKRYLAHNITDIVLGSAFQPEWVFQHTQHDVPANNRYTAVFDDFVENINNKKLLLDHVLLSPGLLTPTGLRKVADSGRIHHTEYNAQVSAGGHKGRTGRPTIVRCPCSSDTDRSSRDRQRPGDEGAPHGDHAEGYRVIDGVGRRAGRSGEAIQSLVQRRASGRAAGHPRIPERRPLRSGEGKPQASRLL